MTIASVSINLGALPTGTGGDTNRAAMQKLVDGLTAVIDAINAGGTVASTGTNDYNQLINLPTLGTAASTATTDYATAAQGIEADTAIQSTLMGVAGGVATLKSDGTLTDAQIPPSLLGQVSYQTTWDASLGTPPTTTPAKGEYWIVSVSGNTALGGVTGWLVGDWAIYDTAWRRVANTDAVSSVAGLTGIVSAPNLLAALSLDLVNNTSDANKPISTAAATALALVRSDLAAQTDATRGTNLIGHEGVTLKYFLDNLPTGTSAATSAPNVSYTPAGTGAAKLTLQAYLDALPVLLTNFWQTGDGTNYTPALGRALAHSLHVIIPAGTFNFATKFDLGAQDSSGNKLYEGARIEGAAQAQTGIGATHITAPAGFLFNSHVASPADKIHCGMYNMYIDGGSGNSTAFGIDGAFGGIVSGVSVENYNMCVRNASAFLCRYMNCYFDRASTWAVSLCDTNGTRIQDCYFGAYSQGHLTNMVTPPLPSGGGNDGEPLIISGNNFNQSDNFSNKTAVWISGLLDMNGNYYEHYGTNAVGNIFCNITSSPYLKGGFTFKNNLVNGQGKALIALQINSTSANEALMFGEVSGNQLPGCVKASIWYGNVDGTNNRCAGVRVYDNFYGTGNTSDNMVLNQSPYCVAGPLSFSESNPATNVVGTTFINLPIFTGTKVDLTKGLISTHHWLNWMYWKSTGYWEIEANIASDGAGTSAAFFLSPSGSSIYTQSGIEVVTGTSGVIRKIIRLAYADKIQVMARNGGTVTALQFSAVYLGDRLSTA